MISRLRRRVLAAASRGTRFDPRRLLSTPRLRHVGRRDLHARAARRLDVDQPDTRIRSVDSVRPERRRADLLRGQTAARTGRGARRILAARPPARDLQAMLSKPARHAIHTWCIRGRITRRDARDHLRRAFALVPLSASLRQPRGACRRNRSRLLVREPHGHAISHRCSCSPASRSTRFCRRSSCSSSDLATSRRSIARALDHGRPGHRELRPADRIATAHRRGLRPVCAAAVVAQPAQRRQGCRCRSRCWTFVTRNEAPSSSCIAGDGRCRVTGRPIGFVGIVVHTWSAYSSTLTIDRVAGVGPLFGATFLVACDLFRERFSLVESLSVSSPR